MAAHRKQHAINDALDHAAGTDGTLLGTESSAVVEKAFSNTAVANNIVQRQADGNIILPAGETAEGDEAISVNQAQTAIDNAVQGLQIKPPVSVGNMIDDTLVTPPGGPATGDAYVVAGLGGLWSGFAVGDIVVWDGAAWQVVVTNAAGVPPDQTRVLVTGYGSGTAAGAFAGQDDSTAVYTTGSGWVFTAPTDGCSVMVIGENEPFENNRYVYDASPAGWYIFMAGNPAHNSTTGIQGGSATERYHLTQAEHTLALDHQAKISLAGAVPVLSDLTSLAADGDWALAEGTGNEMYHVGRVGTKKYAVELGEITV